MLVDESPQKTAVQTFVFRKLLDYIFSKPIQFGLQLQQQTEMGHSQINAEESTDLLLALPRHPDLTDLRTLPNRYDKHVCVSLDGQPSLLRRIGLIR